MRALMIMCRFMSTDGDINALFGRRHIKLSLHRAMAECLRTSVFSLYSLRQFMLFMTLMLFSESVSTVSELLSALSASLLPSTLPQWSSHKWEWDLELRQCIGSEDDNDIAADTCISRLLMRLEEQIRPQAFQSHSNWSLYIQKWSQPLLNIQYRTI